ncbi:MAG: hypothetical protein WC979_09105 [Candidatus Pacearchaeota archaeon]|jgi:hypothetical protein
MFKKVDKEMIERCVKALEFYDEHGHLPYEKKKILVSVSYESLEKLKGKNKSKEIDNLILKN